MKKVLLCITIVAVALSVNAQPKRKNKDAGDAERINPTFSYSPPTRESVASTGITIALLNPVFINRDIQAAGSPWSDFAKAMANDVEDLLTSKGFKVKGPFSSLDEMVVSDKMNSDFIMQISIDIEPKLQRKWKELLVLLSNGKFYKVETGNVSINGKVILTARSCFSDEKLWKKDLELNQKNFSYAGSVRWPTTNVNPYTELNQEVNLWNPICNNLVDLYKASFDILYKQFDKDEMANIAKVSRETDKNRRN